VLLAHRPRRERDSAVLESHPPYALASTSFRFAALASLAGRAPLGGHREVAIATYLAARLAQDVLPGRGLSSPTRAERAVHARNWLATLTLPTPVRPALMRLVDASAGEPLSLSPAVRAVILATAAFLDTAARMELDQLAVALERT
jgi:hypothetical protein